MCLESSSMSILANGSPTEEFMMYKGLNQGDHLAPFLFLVVAEGLATLMRKTMNLDFVKSVSLGKNRVHVYLLQLMDNTRSSSS